MKKLLILMLVLSLATVSFGVIAPVASDYTATLSGTTLTISGPALASGVSVNPGFYDLTDTSMWSGGVELGSPTTAGSLADIAPYSSSSDGYGVDCWGGSTGLEVPAHPAQAGDWFTVTVTGLSVGDSLDVEDVSDGYKSVGTITVLPEPMTIALLGLGGLFLRRRK